MTKDHQTETDDLVDRLEDSKGWPNLGKAAAARIRLDAEVIKAAEEMAKVLDNVTGKTWAATVDMEDACKVDTALAAFRQAQRVRAKKGGE